MIYIEFSCLSLVLQRGDSPQTWKEFLPLCREQGVPPSVSPTSVGTEVDRRSSRQDRTNPGHYDLGSPLPPVRIHRGDSSTDRCPTPTVPGPSRQGGTGGRTDDGM